MTIKIATMIASAILATIPIAAANGAPPSQDAIGIVEGYPNPKHRLTVVSAFSCVYCRIFDTKAMSEIRSVWMKRGVQLETVPVSISPTDIAASIAATCGPAKGFVRRSTIIFRAQPEITSNWRNANEVLKNQATSKPRGQSAPEIAKLSGITSLASSLGLTEAELNTCLNDPKRQARQVNREKLADAKWSVKGTPTIFLDNKPIGSSWESVRAALTAAYR